MDEKRAVLLRTTLFSLVLLLCVPTAQSQVVPLGGQVVWSEDFEAGWGEWFTDAGVWQIGMAESGPSAAWDGQGLAGTNLSGDYPDSTASRLISPFMALPTVEGNEQLWLRVQQWYSYNRGDVGTVELSVWDGSGWGAWAVVAGPTTESSSSDWSLVATDLTRYAGQTVRLAFLHAASSSYHSLGWYIDDVRVWKGAPVLIKPETFEFGWGDWYTDNGIWQIGLPESGPSVAWDGQKVAGTHLSADYPDSTMSRLISPFTVLPTVEGQEQLQLRFWQWYSYNRGDMGTVELSAWDGSEWGAWITVGSPTMESSSSDWSLVATDLTGYAGQTVRLAFHHAASVSHRSRGWYIDDVRLWKGIPTLVNPETFEFGWGDWYTDKGVWQIGMPESGPDAAWDGQGVAGTNLSGDYPDSTQSRLISAPVLLPISPGIQLRFWQWYSYNHGDVGTVEVSVWDGSEWGEWVAIATPTAAASSSGWSLIAADLAGYGGQTIRLAFHHAASVSYRGAGWFIDDVRITPRPEAWMVSEDTGVSRTDRLTKDTTPELTFVFPQDVYGQDSDIVIRDPEGNTLVPDSISGWGTDTIVVDLMPPLTVNGTYVIVLMNTIADAQGQPINNGAMKILPFTLDTVSPFVSWDVQAMPDGKVILTGLVDDPDAMVEVLADENVFAARNNGDGTWMLPAEMIDPAPAGGMYDLVVIATDRAGNVGDGSGTCELGLSSTAGGAITEPGEGLFSYASCEETEVVEAVADEGYRFVRWEGTAWDSGKVTDIDTNDSGSVLEVLVDGIHTLKAVFAPLCRLTLEATGQGSIDASVGDEYLACGTTVQVAARPEVGHRFVRWEGTASDAGKVTVIDANDSGSTAEILVDGAYTLTAVFEPFCCLTLGVVGQGSIDLGVGDRYYACGTALDVCATANDGYEFVRWEGTAVPEGAATEPCISVELDGGDGCDTLTAVFETVIYGELLDSDPEWVFEGQWAFGVPTGQRCSGWGNVDPTSGHTGQNVIGVNLEGCYDLTIGGPYSATAGPFDLSGYSDVKLRFSRWLNCDIPEYVRSTVEVSTDGQNWSVVWEQGEREEITDTEWTLYEYRIPQADLEPTVYVRWTYEVVQERAYAYTGWNLDDIQWIGAPQ